jgi:hypothetical protein
MAVKVKTMKEDATFSINVNKNFYLMVKDVAFYLFQTQTDPEIQAACIKNITAKPYNEQTHYERSLYTLTLLLGEMESVCKTSNLIDEKEILEQGDEGYVEPKED